MYKIQLALFAFITLTISSFAQKSSVANTRKLLTANEWELKYYLERNKKSEIHDELKGLRLVFIPSKDLIYEYTPGSKETVYIRKGKIEEQSFKYVDRIEEPEMIIDIDMLENEGKLSFKNEFEPGGKYAVYEKADKIKNKGYPSEKYEVEKPEIPMQRIHPELEKLTKELSAEFKKTIGNLFFYDKNKARYHIKDLNFEATEYGVKYTYVYDTKDKKNESYSHEFMPERIRDISDVKVDPESRVGRLTIVLDNETSFYKSPISNYANNSVLKSFDLNYFKESVNSFTNIKNKLEELGDAYLMGRANRLEFLSEYVDIGRKIWLSKDGNSSNYELTALYIAGNKIHIHYNLEMIGLSSSQKGSYLTIIPLKDITGITVEKTKSKPNTLLLHSRKGFETFGFKTDLYLPSDKTYAVPLFNYGENGAKQQRIWQILKQLIADDGGEKINVVYNP